MLNQKDIRLVNAALAMGFVTKESLGAWKRLKKELLGSKKTLTNKQSKSLLCPKCGLPKTSYSNFANQFTCNNCHATWKE